MRVNVYWLAVLGAMTLSSCSGGVIAGSSDSQQKEPKKKSDAQKVTNPSDESEDASEPQVVTGGYLDCVSDQGSAQNGEVGFGCGLYDGVTDSKLELGSSKLVLSATNGAGSIVPARHEDDSASSKFHGHLYVSSAAQQGLVIQALLKTPGKVDRPFKTRVVKLSLFGSGGGTDPFKVEKEYSPQELTAWCAGVTSMPYIGSYQNQIDMGTACGADYLSRKGNVLSSLGMLTSMLGSVGICEKPGVTSNQAANVLRCKN